MYDSKEKQKAGTKAMRRMVVAVLAFAIVLSACSVKKMDTDKIQDVEFSVVKPEEIPAELAVEIEDGKQQEMKRTYGDRGKLYVVRGYGVRDVAGYQVEVTGCYEAKDAVVVETKLLGPPRGEKIRKEKTYPFVVIQMEYTEKPIVFDA